MNAKRTIALLTAAAAAAGILFLAGCKKAGPEPYETDGKEIWDTQRSDRNEQNADACYYGCPNSKRVKKLNLLKKRRAF